jgi:hypothetical protein
MFRRLAEGLAMLTAAALIARVIYGLLVPLLPSLVVVLAVGGFLAFIIRGPRAGGGFHN